MGAPVPTRVHQLCDLVPNACLTSLGLKFMPHLESGKNNFAWQGRFGTALV